MGVAITILVLTDNASAHFIPSKDVTVIYPNPNGHCHRGRVNSLKSVKYLTSATRASTVRMKLSGLGCVMAISTWGVGP